MHLIINVSFLGQFRTDKIWRKSKALEKIHCLSRNPLELFENLGKGKLQVSESQWLGRSKQVLSVLSFFLWPQITVELREGGRAREVDTKTTEIILKRDMRKQNYFHLVLNCFYKSSAVLILIFCYS